MNCPKCNKDTAVLVTSEVRAKWLSRLLFGKRTAAHKKQHWHCNYCGHDWPQELGAPAPTGPTITAAEAGKK
jgi:transposase-like protein